MRFRKSEPKARCGPGGEEGAILLLAIWVLTLLSVMVLSWAQEWRTELKLAGNFRDASQCHLLAEAGVYYALGKLLAAKSAEQEAASLPESQPLPADIWRVDQSRHVLELSGGRVEVRIVDEAGKLNVNLVYGKVLASLFEVLGFSEAKLRVMVDSILDWRSKGERPRPFGARSDYYLRLDPPYPAKNGRLDTVEELAWVRGFTGNNLAGLSSLLTVQDVGLQINVNTAPKEVLEAVGLPAHQVRNLIQLRQIKPLSQLAEAPQVTADPQAMQMMQTLTFQSSPFFTILATGMVNIKEGPHHTIKAIVRLEMAAATPWTFVYWADDYPD